MKILFLDDDEFRWKKFKNENPNADATWVSSYNAAVTLLENTDTCYDLAYLDHDLAFYERTGMDFVNYIVSKKKRIERFICHSMNPIGRENMATKLYGNGYAVLNMPHAWDYKVENVQKLF
jgi:hypothetical protein